MSSKDERPFPEEAYLGALRIQRESEAKLAAPQPTTGSKDEPANNYDEMKHLGYAHVSGSGPAPQPTTKPAPQPIPSKDELLKRIDRIHARLQRGVGNNTFFEDKKERAYANKKMLQLIEAYVKEQVTAAHIEGQLSAYENLSLRRQYGMDYQESLDFLEEKVDGRIAELKAQLSHQSGKEEV